MSEEPQEDGSAVPVNVADLYLLHTTLRHAFQFHLSRDKMNAAVHLEEPEPRELTNQIYHSAKLVESLIDQAEAEEDD